MGNKYTIDCNGTGGRYRVWWLSPSGHTCERLFSTRESAELWVDETELIESDDAARNASILHRNLPVMNADRGKN